MLHEIPQISRFHAEPTKPYTVNRTEPNRNRLRDTTKEHTGVGGASKEEAREIVNEYNSKLGVTRAQEEAMRTGSMFGFHVPGADPKNYDKDGKPLPPKDRGDAR